MISSPNLWEEPSSAVPTSSSPTSAFTMKKMVYIFDMVLEEPITDNHAMYKNINRKEQNLVELSSQECVEDRSNTTNMMWASVRNVNIRSTGNKPTTRGRTHWHTSVDKVTPPQPVDCETTSDEAHYSTNDEIANYVM